MPWAKTTTQTARAREHNPHNAAALSPHMVSWLPHAVLPGLVALAFFRSVPRKIVFATVPIVWLIDADYLIPSQHRAITHSILIPLALFAAVVVLWRRREPRARLGAFLTRPGAPVVLTMLAYYWASHLVLDLFQGGVVLLWPLVNTNFYLAFEILLDTGNNTFTPGSEAGTSEGAPELSPLYPWFSTEHTAYLAFLAACATVGAAVWVWRKATGRNQTEHVGTQRTDKVERTIRKP